MKLDVLQRLAASPFSRVHLWSDAPVLGLEIGEARWLLRDRGVWDWSAEPVDAWLRCTPEDLGAMLSRRVPPGVVSYRLGDRDIAARRKQAHALLALAALGWAGPWPDPAADPEHIGLVREALYALGIGPDDGRAPILPPGSPLDGVAIRVTDGAAARSVVTVGLSDTVGRCELMVELPPRAPVEAALRPLRAAALWVAETGAVPPARLGLGPLVLSCDPALRDGLPLPNQRTSLIRVRRRA